MSNVTRIFLRWLPAFSVMLVIFLLSSRPSSELPDFDWADRIVKKAGHLIGYALLAIAYWRALHFRQERCWLAWGMALLYAVTDEYHQSFVLGRSPSVGDVLIFDNLGALIALWLVSRYKRQRSDSPGPIAEAATAKH